MGFIERIQEKFREELERRNQEEERWYPEPSDEACEFPDIACPTVNLPCNRCPYHQEQY